MNFFLKSSKIFKNFIDFNNFRIFIVFKKKITHQKKKSIKKMTHILYFGSVGSRPYFQPPPPDDPLLQNPSLKIISFDPSVLLSHKISCDGSHKLDEYNEFMKLIDFPTLRFKKVLCGSHSIYILDTKSELWCLGACNSGQLGISAYLLYKVMYILYYI